MVETGCGCTVRYHKPCMMKHLAVAPHPTCPTCRAMLDPGTAEVLVLPSTGDDVAEVTITTESMEHTAMRATMPEHPMLSFLSGDTRRALARRLFHAQESSRLHKAHASLMLGSVKFHHVMRRRPTVYPRLEACLCRLLLPGQRQIDDYWTSE